MPDFGAPVAQNVNAGNGLQTLSDLMSLKQRQIGIAQQQLALAQGQQTLSQLTSQATVAAIKANQEKNLSQVNWKQYVQPDGSYDIDSAEKQALLVAPNIGPDFISRLSAMTQSSVAAKKAYYDLNQTYQDNVRAAFGTWAGDPKANISDLATQLDAIEENAPKDTQDSIRTIVNHTLGVIGGPDLITGAPKTLDQQKSQALAYSRVGLSPEQVSGPGGLATPVPGTVSTGTQVIPTTTNRETGITSAPNAPPVTNQSIEVTLPNGQVGVLDLATRKISIAGGGNGAAQTPPAPSALTSDTDPAKPPANAPAATWAAWNQSVQHTQASVESARQSDAQYGNQMAIAEEVRDLSKGANTGPGTPEWTRLIGTLSSRFGGSQGITDVQTLESFLDRQAAGMREAMGLPATNAGAEQAQIIGGNIGMQGGALRAKNDYNEALAQGLHDYRRGLDRVAGFGGNASPTAVNQYRAQWTQYFNPLAYEYKLAKSRGDTEMVKSILSKVTKEQAATMVRDLKATDALSRGQLPQAESP